MAAVLRDPSYQRGFGFLADRRHVEAPTTAYIQRAASAIVQQRERIGGGRLAVVVSNPAAFGMARMGQILGEDGGMAIRVFRDIDQAEAWLRAPASTE